MYDRFGLVLMVTQHCNMRCDYCYSTKGTGMSMPLSMGQKAIDRAVVSILPGGSFHLGFFGGEPLLESETVLSLVAHAQQRATSYGVNLGLSLTTNGTIDSASAWSVVMMPEMGIAVSYDGRPETHNQSRRFANGQGSAVMVECFVKKLIERDKPFRIAMVVQPKGLAELHEELRYQYQLGVRHIDLALDLWARWESADLERLEQAIVRCAELWGAKFPEWRINWFEDKAAHLVTGGSDVPCGCGFGKGDVAVSVSGYLYPCERLIGQDQPDHPMRLPGHVNQGQDFLFGSAKELRQTGECQSCAIKTLCNTFCGCCNHTRSGDVGRPDRLLCMWNQWCLRETAAHLNKIISLSLNKENLS